MTNPILYTVREAATRLRISQSLTYQLLKKNRIRHTRHGIGRGTIRIALDALEEYEKAAEVQPPAAPTDDQPLRFIKTR